MTTRESIEAGEGDATTSIKTRLRSAKYRVSSSDDGRTPSLMREQEELLDETIIQAAPTTPAPWQTDERQVESNLCTPTSQQARQSRLEAHKVEEMMRNSYMEALRERECTENKDTPVEDQAAARLRRICPGCVDPSKLHTEERIDPDLNTMAAAFDKLVAPVEVTKMNSTTQEQEDPFEEEEEENPHPNMIRGNTRQPTRGYLLDEGWKQEVTATLATLCSSMKQEFSGMMESERQKIRQELADEQRIELEKHTDLHLSRNRNRKRPLSVQRTRSASVEGLRNELEGMKETMRECLRQKEEEKRELEYKLTLNHDSTTQALREEIDLLKRRMTTGAETGRASTRMPEVPTTEAGLPRSARGEKDVQEATTGNQGVEQTAKTGETDTVANLRAEIAQLQELLRAPTPRAQEDVRVTTTPRITGIAPLPPNIKLPRFNGENWYSFEDLFETIAKLQQWQGTEKLTWFLSCIDEKARMYLEVEQDELLTYEQARQSMEERYGNRMSTFDLKRRIRALKRNSGESMEAFADRLQAIAQRGRIDKEEKMDLFYRAFIDAVSEEPKLQMYIEQQKKQQRRARLPDLLRMVREYRERSPLRVIQEREVNVCQSIDKRKGPLRHQDNEVEGEVEKETRRVKDERMEKKDRGDRILRSDVDYNTGEIEFVKKVIRASGLMEGIKDKLEKMKSEKSFLEPLGDGTPEPDWQKIRQRQREFRERRNARRAKFRQMGGGYDRQQNNFRNRRSVSTHTAQDGEFIDQEEVFWSDEYADDE